MHLKTKTWLDLVSLQPLFLVIPTDNCSSPFNMNVFFFPAGCEQDQRGEAATVSGWHQQENSQLSGPAQRAGWGRCRGQAPPAPAGWDDRTGVSDVEKPALQYSVKRKLCIFVLLSCILVRCTQNKFTPTVSLFCRICLSLKGYYNKWVCFCVSLAWGSYVIECLS